MQQPGGHSAVAYEAQPSCARSRRALGTRSWPDRGRLSQLAWWTLIPVRVVAGTFTVARRCRHRVGASIPLLTAERPCHGLKRAPGLEARGHEFQPLARYKLRDDGNGRLRKSLTQLTDQSTAATAAECCTAA